MNKFYLYLTVFASLTMGLASCSETPNGAENEQEPPTTDTPSGSVAATGYQVELRAEIKDDNGARASFDETDLKTLSWDSDDALGLFIHEEESEEHIATNVRMGFVGTPESSLFEGTIFSNPETRTADWNLFAYYPYNRSAVDSNVYHENSWLVKHASRQTQIDANHTNYDKYAFFSSSNNVWAVGEECPTVNLVDRTTALRFLIKADESAPANLGVENLEEVDIFVTKKSTFEEKGIKVISASDGVRALSGHFLFNHETGAYTAIEGETRNYVEVDFFGASTRAESFELKITADNDTYVWAVVPPFTLADDELLVAEFNTASYKVVYAYDRDGDFAFAPNTLYNFKNVKAIGGLGEDCNIVSNDPVIHTNDYILGESAEATILGIDNQQIKYRYPLNATLTMTIDLPVDPAYIEEGAMKYYIRYGYCDYCGADGGANHNGLDVPYSEVVEGQVSWAHEIDNAYDVSQYNATPVTDDEGHEFGTYRLSYKCVVDDAEFMKEAFNGKHDPVYQAYAVYKSGTAEEQIFYGHVVHVDMDPFISDFGEYSYVQGSLGKTPIVLKGTQFYLNIPDAYFFNGTAPAPYYWVNTIASLRVYRCDISASVNGDGSLKTATLEEAVALNATTTTLLPRLQTINAQSGYTGFYTDINTNGNGFIRYRENGGDRYDLATTAYDDYNGAYCYVMQAYDKQTMELVWIRSEYFRLSDVKANSAQ